MHMTKLLVININIKNIYYYVFLSLYIKYILILNKYIKFQFNYFINRKKH